MTPLTLNVNSPSLYENPEAFAAPATPQKNPFPELINPNLETPVTKRMREAAKNTSLGNNTYGNSSPFTFGIESPRKIAGIDGTQLTSSNGLQIQPLTFTNINPSLPVVSKETIPADIERKLNTIYKECSELNKRSGIKHKFLILYACLIKKPIILTDKTRDAGSEIGKIFTSLSTYYQKTFTPKTRLVRYISSSYYQKRNELQDNNYRKLKTCFKDLIECLKEYKSNATVNEALQLTKKGYNQIAAQYSWKPLKE